MTSTTINQKNMFRILDGLDGLDNEPAQVATQKTIDAPENPDSNIIIREPNSSPVSRKYKKKNKAAFYVHGKSYIDELNDEKMNQQNEIVKSLSCTQACKHVVRKTPDNDYGVCFRKTCSFAHSLDELNDPMCSFSISCRFRWGHPQRDGSNDTYRMCKFRHPDEDRENWVKRTGRSLPDLPETSEKTRKPAHTVNTNTKHNKRFVTPSSNPTTTPITPITPITQPITSHPRGAPIKKNWFPTPNFLEKSDEYHLSPKRLNYSSDSTHSSDCEDGQIHNRESRSPRDSKTYIIRVPTKELATFAISAAFDRGVFDIRVIIE